MRFFWRKVHSFRFPYGYGAANRSGLQWPKIAAQIANMPYYERMRLFFVARTR